MNDTERLQDKLAKLSSAKENIGAGGREISARDKSGFLLAILNEIDETVMARLLVFRNDAGNTVELEVVNRRLLRVAGSSTQAMPDTTLPGQVFSEANGLLATSLSEVLEKFLTESEQVFVQAKRLEQAPDPTIIGCACKILAQAWSLNLYPSHGCAAADLIEKFIATCADIASAWVQIENGNVEHTGGAEKQVKRLVEIVDETLVEFDAGLNKHLLGSKVTRCVTLGPQGETGDVVLYAKSMTSGAVMVLPDAHLTDVIAKWRSLQA
ncbi:MAG: hypothetical protein KUG69_08630 [Marinosulfonomonas sp.]|nr:hypothetical protein [Marinosulfonomonas sp.]